MVERLTLAAGPATSLATSLVAPLLLLAGCGSDNSIADPPPLSPPTSYSTHAPMRESPEHFIRRFVAVSNRMERRGSTRRYLALTDDCKPCRELATQVATARQNGGFYRSLGWSIRAIHVGATADRGTVDVTVISAPTSLKLSAGSQALHYTGGRLKFRLAIRHSVDGWHVTNVVQVAS